MGLRGPWTQRSPGAERPAHAEPPLLIVKTRCVLVADVVAVNADGSQEALVTGVDEEAARDFFQEITGRPWTGAEMERAGRRRGVASPTTSEVPERLRPAPQTA